MLFESFFLIMIIAVIVVSVINTVTLFTAWSFVFHFVKQCKPLPRHMRPPGWPPRTCKTPTIR